MPDSKEPPNIPVTEDLAQQMVNGMAASMVINKALLTESQELRGEVVRFQGEVDRLSSAQEQHEKTLESLCDVVRDGTAQEKPLVVRMTKIEGSLETLIEAVKDLGEERKECKADCKSQTKALAELVQGIQKTQGEGQTQIRVAEVKAGAQAKAAEIKGRWDWKTAMFKTIIGLLIAAGGGGVTLLIKLLIDQGGSP